MSYLCVQSCRLPGLYRYLQPSSSTSRALGHTKRVFFHSLIRLQCSKKSHSSSHSANIYRAMHHMLYICHMLYAIYTMYRTLICHAPYAIYAIYYGWHQGYSRTPYRHCLIENYAYSMLVSSRRRINGFHFNSINTCQVCICTIHAGLPKM